MYEYKPFGKGRSSAEDKKAFWKEYKGIELVEGYGNIVDATCATENSKQVATFVRAKRAWYVCQGKSEHITWETGKVPEDVRGDVVFVFVMGMGEGSPSPQPTGRFDLCLGDEHIVSFRVVKHDQLWSSGNVKLHYEVKRYAYAPENIGVTLDPVITNDAHVTLGIGVLRVPLSMVEPGASCRLSVRAVNQHDSRRWFKLDEFKKCILETDYSKGVHAVCDDVTRSTFADHTVYFGDIHSHSGLGTGGQGTGCGSGTPESNYEYARDVSALDFYCLTDHDFDYVDQDDWQRRKMLADKYNEPEKFVTLYGFEWTSRKCGHRNVYYLEDTHPYYSAGPWPCWTEEDDTPEDLWEKLRGLEGKVITVPHHPPALAHPLSWEYYNQVFDRLVEVYSCWGNSEYAGNPFIGYASDHARYGMYVQDALAKGFRYGLIGSSDGHDGNPGNAQGLPKQPHLYHALGSGWVGVWSKNLDRQSIFEALYNRRVYATTGVPIVLGFQVNDAFMGSEVPVKQYSVGQELRITVEGTCALKEVVLLKNCRRVMKWTGEDGEKNMDILYVDNEPIRDNVYYYVRVVQEDGEMAWSSPVWLLPEVE